MNKEYWIRYKGKWIKNPSKWILFKRWIKFTLKRWKIVDSTKYWIIPEDDRKYHFILSEKEYNEAEKLYKEKGTISYEFYPCAGFGWGIKIHVLKTDEIIDITSYDNW